MQLSSCFNRQLFTLSLTFSLLPLTAMDQDAKRDADAKAQHEALENSAIAQFAKNKWPHFLMHMGPIANDFARGIPLREEYDKKYNAELLMDKVAMDRVALAVCLAAQCAAEKADEEDHQSGHSDNDILREHAIASAAQYFPHPELMKTLLGLSFKVASAKDNYGHPVDPSTLVSEDHPYKDEVQKILNDQHKHEIRVELQHEKQKFVAVVSGALQGVMQTLGTAAQHVAGKVYELADYTYETIKPVAVNVIDNAPQVSPAGVVNAASDLTSAAVSKLFSK